MSSNVSLCAFCNGPLVVTLGSVTCSYCGKPNQPTGIPSKTEMRRVVREVVNEDLNNNGIPDALEPTNPAPSPRPTMAAGSSSGLMWFLSIGVGVMVVAGFAAAMLFRGAPARYATSRPSEMSPSLQAKRNTDATTAPEAPPPLKAPQAYWMDKSFIFLASENWLAKVDRTTLAMIWKTRRNSGPAALVRLIGDRVFVTSARAAEFYVAESGVETGRYQYRDSSFPPNAACSVGSHVLIATSFQPQLRLDATTAKKVSGKGSCSLDWWRYISCPVGQQCSQRPSRRGDLQCRATLRSKGREYIVCETDDGAAKRSTVVAISGNKELWTTFLEAPLTGEVGYIGIVDDMLVVGAQSALAGLSPASGKLVWSRPGATYRSIVHSDERRVYFADETTFNIIEAKSGSVVATLQSPAVPAERPVAP